MAAERPVSEPQLRVVIADERAETRTWLRRALGGAYRIEEHTSCVAALEALDDHPPDVLILGGTLRDLHGAELLAEAKALEERGRGAIPLLVVESEGEGRHDDVRELLQDSSVFYVIKRPLPAAEVRRLVDSAVRQGSSKRREEAEVRSAPEAARLQHVLEAARRLASARDLETATAVLVSAVLELTDADRAQCLFFDSESGTLWTEDGSEHDESDRTAAVGIAGFAARTGAEVSAPRAASDPRFVREVDDPQGGGPARILDDDPDEATHVSKIADIRGGGDERILAQPIASDDGEVHVVLVAVRDGQRPEFETGARTSLATLAARCGPLLHQLALEIGAEAVISETREHDAGEGDVFRREALEASAARRTSGDVVRVSPTWVLWSYWLIVGIVLATGVYVSLGTVSEYSAGPAFIRAHGRTDVTAPVSGTVTSIDAEPGESVEAGDPLARFYDASEAADLRRVENQWETQLRNYLFDPTDEAARRALANLRAERQQARERLEDRVVHAPHAGVVSDIRVREGRHLRAGNVLMTIARESDEGHVIALLPGADRPHIEPGMPIRIELSGFRYAYQQLEVDRVADEVIGPQAAQRVLGEEIAELPIPPSVVVVSAKLPSPTFRADGETYRYHDGMHGNAEAKMRSERIITALIPGLKGL